MAEETETRKRPTRRPARKPKPTPSRKPPSPPNRVEPGFIHRKIATTILSTLQQRAASNGIPLSVGELPLPANESGEAGPADDGREPVELLARIIAHIAHRIPGLRKVEKRLEGTNARSGLGSDLLALLAQLFSRNEETAVTIAEGVVKQSFAKGKAPEPAPAPNWGGEPITTPEGE